MRGGRLGERVSGPASASDLTRFLAARLTVDVSISGRGGKFLKRWMEFLQENGDLRYPDVDEVCAFSS